MGKLSYKKRLKRYARKEKGICPNCKEQFKENETGHFVPPSFGDSGFFVCTKRNKKASHTRGSI